MDKINVLEEKTKEQVLILEILQMNWLWEGNLKNDILYEIELRDHWFCFESFRTLLEDHFDYSPEIRDLFSNRWNISAHKCLINIKEHFLSINSQDSNTNTLVEKIIKK